MATIAEPVSTAIGSTDTARGGTRKIRGICERVLVAGESCSLATMLQLTTAGGLSSTVIGSLKPHKRTGAGVPHWPLRIGSSACTSAPAGANSETQRRNAPITSASDQMAG